MRWFRERDNIALLALLLLGLTAYFTVKNYNGHVGGVTELDGYYYYVYLRSIQMDGDLQFANEYKEWGNPFDLGKAEKTGRERNIFGVGPAILWSPFFLITHLLALIGIKLGYPLIPDGFSRFHVVGTLVGSVFYGWLGVLLTYRLVRHAVGKAHALWATLAVVLAGPLPFYCLALSAWSHATATMATSLLCLLWFRWRGEWTTRRWALFGASAGMVLLMRTACLPFMLLPLMEGVRVIAGAARRRPFQLRDVLMAARGPALGAACAVLVFSPQLVVWKILFGSFVVVPQGEGFMRWAESSWASTLFSPRNGVFTMAPLLGLGIVGLLLGLRRRASLVIPLGLVLAGMTVINGAAYDWWGWGFSARRFTSSLPIFAVGFGLVLATVREALARRPKRAIAWITGGIISIFILFNLQWMFNFSQKAMTWYNLRNTQAIYMTVLHSLTDKVFKEVGNPLSLPGSMAFKLRKGGSLRAYDRVDGHFMLGENHPLANPAANQMDRAGSDLTKPRFHHNLSDSFDYPKVTPDGVRYVPLRRPRGHIFLPINRPGGLAVRLGCRAMYPGTRVQMLINGAEVARQVLPSSVWSMVAAQVPEKLLERGINRLDLIHELPRGWDAAPPRTVGETGVESPVDLAVVSGSALAGNFAEVWVDNRKVSDNERGMNVAVVDPKTGQLLGERGFDVIMSPVLWKVMGEYLDRFPAGSLVALAERDDTGRHFETDGGAATLARLGASTELSEKDRGYVAIGVLGAPAGTAMENEKEVGHVRLRVGRKPPPWREVMQYRFLQVR